MTMSAASAVDGARRAALALHALGPADRAWLLERLPRERRAEVEALLAELAALGIPQDRMLVENIVVKRPTEVSTQPSGARIAKVLAGEPAALVALALHAHDDAKRDRVPAALREALVREVESCLSTANDTSPPAPQPLLRRWQAGWVRISGGLA